MNEWLNEWMCKWMNYLCVNEWLLFRPDPGGRQTQSRGTWDLDKVVGARSVVR